MRYGFGRLVLIVIAGAILAGSPWPATAQAVYTPPIGIPVPPFGIDQSHTMYDGQVYQAGGFVYRDAGGLSATDTVQIVVVSMEVLFEDDFDDNDLAGWTMLEGTFETFQYLAEPGYEAHATTANSRMRADLTSTSLSDDVRVSFKTRHTGGTGGSGDTGLKTGRLWLVDDSGVGFGLSQLHSRSRQPLGRLLRVRRSAVDYLGPVGRGRCSDLPDCRRVNCYI